jgi:hypothetical protein
MNKNLKIPYHSLSLSNMVTLLQLTNGYCDADSQSIILPIPEHLQT